MLRAFGVVGAFVEFAGDGLAGLSLADRATISNMSPEFGATSTLFPIDDETLTYLRLTGRSDERVDLVERYAKAQGLWREPGDGPEFDALLELDLGDRGAVARRAAAAAGPGRAGSGHFRTATRTLPRGADRADRPDTGVGVARRNGDVAIEAGGRTGRTIEPRARSRSPRSRRARTRPTRPSWSARGCSPGTRSRAGSP